MIFASSPTRRKWITVLTVIVLLYLFVCGIIVKNSQLALLVNRECGVVKTLVIWPGLFYVAHVPFADVYRVIAGFR